MLSCPDPKCERRAVRGGIVLGVAEHTILRVLARYQYLTAQQIRRLAYAAGSLTYVQMKLKRLSETGYLERLFLPRPSRTGSAPTIYCPTRKTLALLERQGIEVPRRIRSSEVRAHAYLFLAHTLAVNDVLVAAELLCRDQPQLELASLCHELALKRQPLQVTLGDGSSVGVIPDGWLDIRIHELSREYQSCFALEVDRGSVEQRAWRRKVRALLAWSRGPYVKAFGTTSLTVMVVATPGGRRCRELMRWTEAELHTLGAQGESDLFRFTGQSATTLQPVEFFLTPQWHRLFDPRPLRLIKLAAVG